MFKEMDRRRLALMANVSCASPFIYGLICFFLQEHTFRRPEYIKELNIGLLLFSFILLLASRALENLLAPPGSSAKELPPGRAALTCLLLSGIAEGIAFLGLVVVMLGAGLKTFIPYFLLSSLAFADFRLTRFQRILELAPDSPPD